MAKIAGFQFGHVEWFSKAGSSKQHTFKSSHGTQRGRGWSSADVLAEAERKKGHCQHVESPQPPTILHGSFDKVREAARTWAATQTVEVKLKDGTVKHRAMRSDGPEMAAGVISFPRDRMDEWEAYRDHAIKELKKKHGERLRLVLEHLDENHPHIHYYLVPKPGEDFGVVHDGYKASREARSQPGNKIRTAFNEAMKGWQDWLQEAVAKPFGLARIGPARARSTRKEWRKDEVRRLEEREATVATKEQTLSAEVERVAKLMTDIERREDLLVKKQEQISLMEIMKTASVATQLLKTKDETAKLHEQAARLVKENEAAKAELRNIFDKFGLLQQQAVQVHAPRILEMLEVKTTKIDSLGL